MPVALDSGFTNQTSTAKPLKGYELTHIHPRLRPLMEVWAPP
jgi:hypothetical protein